VQAEHRRLRGRDPVDVRVDEHLVVGPVDRGVQDGPVQPDLDVLHGAQRPEQRQGVADPGRHGVADALFRATLGDVRPFRVAEGDLDGDTRAPLGGEDLKHPRVLGEEQRAVGQDADLTLGRTEQPYPGVTRDGPPVRVDRTELVRPCPGSQRPARIGP
jgi:hypothetical protein